MAKPKARSSAQKPADGRKPTKSASAERQKRPVGRPTIKTPELVDAICAWVSDGKSVRSFCEQEGNPSKSTIMKWMAEDDEFRTRLTCARELQADAIVDDVLDIADDGRNDTYETANGAKRVDHEIVARSKLRVEARLRLAALLNPKKYGERLELSGGLDINKLSDEQLDAKLAALVAKARRDKAADDAASGA